MDGRYYIGSTANLQKRMQHHQGGFTTSTKRMGELQLVFHQETGSLKEARHIESKLKKLKRRDYLEKIIKDGYIKSK